MTISIGYFYRNGLSAVLKFWIYFSHGLHLISGSWQCLEKTLKLVVEVVLRRNGGEQYNSWWKGNMLSSCMLIWVVVSCSDTCRNSVLQYSYLGITCVWSGLNWGHLFLFWVSVFKWLAPFQWAAFRADKSRCIDLPSLAHLKLHTWNTWNFAWSQCHVLLALHFCLATIQFLRCRNCRVRAWGKRYDISSW